MDEYILQTPEEMEKSRIGVCWDSAEYARMWFEEHKKEYNYKYVYLEIQNKVKSTHTFIVFNIKKRKELFILEGAWQQHKGIHGPFKTIEEACKYYNELSCDIVNEEAAVNFHLVDKPPLKHASCQQFMHHCSKAKPFFKLKIKDKI